MNGVKFKSGDKVVFCKSSLESGMIDAKEGDVFTIKECHGPGGRVVSLEELSGYYHKTHFEHYVEKEKVMEKYIPKVGEKVKGFKFDSGTDGVGYDAEMDDYVEEVGKVVDVYTDSFVVEFPDSLEWMYPTSLSHLAKIEEPARGLSHEDSQIDWQIGQVVWDIMHGKGEVVSIASCLGTMYPVEVCFDKSQDEGVWFTLDGKYYASGIRTLFFSEPKIIAETKPPKKPFVQVLKEGDKVVIQTTDYDFIATIVSEDEEEIFIKRQVSGIRYPKNCIKVYKLGEQVKFS